MAGQIGVGWAQVNPVTEAPIEQSSSQIRTPDGNGSDSNIGSGNSGSPAGSVAGVTFFDAPRAMYATTSSRVRSGPGTNHGLVGTIPFAGQVQVYGESTTGGWVYLEMADGSRGFTAARLLSNTQPTASSGSTGTTTTPPVGQSGPVCVSGEVLIQLGDGRAICAVLQ